MVLTGEAVSHQIGNAGERKQLGVRLRGAVWTRWVSTPAGHPRRDGM